MLMRDTLVVLSGVTKQSRKERIAAMSFLKRAGSPATRGVFLET